VGRKAVIAESELYEPVRAHLEALGYTVRSEVHHCDIAAIRGDELVVVELKRSLTLTLVLQATRRQRITGSVYVAVPRPRSMGRQTKWRDLQHLLRRLELGLILVTLGRTPRVEVAFHPVPFRRQKRQSLARAVIAEMNGRSAEHNRGGSRGVPLVTAYREEALRIAWLLDLHGPASPRALRTHGSGPKTQSLLYTNVYGWFDRVDRGVYALNGDGRAALEQFKHVIETFGRAP
jgi:hypothetical protein